MKVLRVTYVRKLLLAFEERHLIRTAFSRSRTSLLVLLTSYLQSFASEFLRLFSPLSFSFPFLFSFFLGLLLSSSFTHEQDDVFLSSFFEDKVLSEISLQQGGDRIPEIQRTCENYDAKVYIYRYILYYIFVFLFKEKQQPVRTVYLLRVLSFLNKLRFETFPRILYRFGNAPESKVTRLHNYNNNNNYYYYYYYYSLYKCNVKSFRELRRNILTLSFEASKFKVNFDLIQEYIQRTLRQKKFTSTISYSVLFSVPFFTLPFF